MRLPWITPIGSDWSALGRTPTDLSFTLVGMYETGFANEPLREYASALRVIAGSDPQVSFIDLFELTPGYAEAVSRGYIRDGLHLERPGALAYGDVLMQTLTSVPEPGMMTGLLGLAGILLRRKARTTPRGG